MGEKERGEPILKLLCSPISVGARFYTIFRLSMSVIGTRDGKMTIFFGPAHNTIFNFRPVWAHLGPSQKLLSLMFYTKTTNTKEIIMLIGF